MILFSPSAERIAFILAIKTGDFMKKAINFIFFEYGTFFPSL